MMEVQRFKTKEEAIEKAALHLNLVLGAHVHVPILFLSSGGSSLALLEHIDVFPPNLTVGMTDERFSQDPKVNNFAQLAETLFFQRAQEHGVSFIDTRVQLKEDVTAYARRFEDALSAWRQENKTGRVVITQGMGSDAHTAGIMPYPKDKDTFQELFEGDRLVQGYDAKDKNEFPLRATITLPFLRQVDHSILFMSGKEKSGALSHTLNATGTLWETPSRIVHEMKDVVLFVSIAE